MKEINPYCVKHNCEFIVRSNTPNEYHLVCESGKCELWLNEIICPCCYSQLYVINSQSPARIMCSNPKCDLWFIADELYEHEKGQLPHFLQIIWNKREIGFATRTDRKKKFVIESTNPIVLNIIQDVIKYRGFKI